MAGFVVADSEVADPAVQAGGRGPDDVFGGGRASAADHAEGVCRRSAQARRPAAAARVGGMADEETVRVDLWIWSVRLVKTRSMATAACRGGHVRVNDERVKPSAVVRTGDEVRLRHAGRERVVVVKRIVRKRVGAPVAAECFADISPPPPPREALMPMARPRILMRENVLCRQKLRSAMRR